MTCDKKLGLLLSIIALFAVSTICACNQYPSQKDKRVSKKYKKLSKTDNQDSIIDFPCAVLVYPDLKTINALKKNGSEEDYTAAVDDNQYYMAQCIDYLDSVKTRQVIKETKGSISFKNVSGKIFKIPLDSMYWGVLLFNGKSAPIKADMTLIENDYKPYMKR